MSGWSCSPRHESAIVKTANAGLAKLIHPNNTTALVTRSEINFRPLQPLEALEIRLL